MTDYFARRSAELQITLERIAAATTPRCWACGHILHGDEPSDLFCSAACHNSGLRYTADPDTVTADPVEDWEWSGALTAAQARKRDAFRRRANVLHRLPARDDRFRRVYLNQPTPARHDNQPCSITPILGSAAHGRAIDEVTAPDVDFDAFREAFRAMADGLTEFITRWGDAVRDLWPVIESITDNSDQYNRHLRMAPDDPRRAILHHVQNRNTGPQSTPFAKRGRR